MLGAGLCMPVVPCIFMESVQMECFGMDSNIQTSKEQRTHSGRGMQVSENEGRERGREKEKAGV